MVDIRLRIAADGILRGFGRQIDYSGHKESDHPDQWWAVRLLSEFGRRSYAVQMIAAAGVEQY